MIRRYAYDVRLTPEARFQLDRLMTEFNTSRSETVETLIEYGYKNFMPKKGEKSGADTVSGAGAVHQPVG